MRLNLVAKITIGTLAVVALVMIAFAVVMGRSIASEARERAQLEAAVKSAEVLNALQIVDTLSSKNVVAAMKVMMSEMARMGKPELKGTVPLNGRTVSDLRLGGSSQV